MASEYTSKAELFAATLGDQLPDDPSDFDEWASEREDRMPPYVLDGGYWFLESESPLHAVTEAADAIDEATALLHRLAVQAVEDGQTKTAVAEAAGISRPTLDAWIDAADARVEAQE